MDKEKYVDESWKDAAIQEKDQLESASPQSSDAKVVLQGNRDKEASTQEAGQPASMEINFLNYITSLGFQAMIFLGEIPNPATNDTDKNIEQAKFLIDTLTMLKDKTKGNLTDQESDLLGSSVYELQLKYVNAVEKEDSSNA